MSDERSVFLREGSISFVGSLYDKAVRYLFLAVVTYLIAPEVFGEFTLLLSVMSLLYNAFNFNVHRSISYYVPQLLEEGDRAAASTLVRRIAAVLTAVGVLVGGAFVLTATRLTALVGLPRGSESFVLVLALLVPLYALRDVQRELFRSFESVRYIVLTMSFVFPTLRVLALLVALTFLSAALALATSIVFAMVVALAVGAVFALRLGLDYGESSESTPPWRQILGYSVPLMGVGFLGNITGYVDIILLGVLSSSADVAFFKIAFSVAALAKMVPQMFKSISKPLYSKVSSESVDADLSEFYLTTARWTAFVTVPACGFILVEHRALVAVLFGSSYAPAAVAVPILVVGNGLMLLVGYTNMLLEGTGHTRVLFVRASVMLAVNGVLDVLLIPEYGIVGAAIGTAAGLVGGAVVGVVAAVRYELRRLPLSRPHLVYLVAGAVSGLLVLPLPAVVSPAVTLIVEFAVFGQAYVLACVALRGLTETDLMLVEDAAEEVEARTGYRPERVVRIARFGVNSEEKGP